MELFSQYLILGAGIVVAAVFLKIAICLWRADKVEGKKGAARVRSVKDAILGRARMHLDGIPDARVKGGLLYNQKDKRLEITGRLSDDSFDRVFR